MRYLFVLFALLPGVTIAQLKPVNIWDACGKNDVEYVTQYLEKGGDPSARGFQGTRPLDAAVGMGNTQVVKLLLEAGADPNALDDRRSTPLHTAAFLGEAQCARMLLDYDADPSIMNVDGATPADVFALDEGTTKWIGGMFGVQVDFAKVEKGRQEIAAMLEDRGFESKPSNKQQEGEAFFAFAMFLWSLLWFVCSLALCISLSRAIQAVPKEHRQIGMFGIWMLMIPGWHFVWNFFAPRKVSDSLGTLLSQRFGDQEIATGKHFGHWYALCAIGTYAVLPTTLAAAPFTMGFLVAFIFRNAKCRRIAKMTDEQAAEYFSALATEERSRNEEVPAVKPLPPAERRHDLDALRAIAMLLGIGLHVALSFATNPWPVQDSRQNPWFTVAFEAIHGFRMPLFFVLSGFFTAMLWRRRGLSKLLVHRYRRVFLPCVLGLITIVPLVNYSFLGVATLQGIPMDKMFAGNGHDPQQASPSGQVVASTNPRLSDANSDRIAVTPVSTAENWKPPEDETEEEAREEEDEATQDAVGEALKGFAAFFAWGPIFNHLWFLWFLIWLVLAFAIYAKFSERFGFGGLPDWLILSPLRYLWLVPLTFLTYKMMGHSLTFGPDTSMGLIPSPTILAYYGVFFGFGAIYYDSHDTRGHVSRWWFLSLPLALLVVFPTGMQCLGKFCYDVPFVNADFAKGNTAFWANVMRSLFVWMMTFGSMGLFKFLFSSESKTMRYISDSSYWLYLAHMPLVFWAQWMVRSLDIHPAIKFFVLCTVLTAILLCTYHWFVRYTWIGTMLNGPKQRRAAGSS